MNFHWNSKIFPAADIATQRCIRTGTSWSRRSWKETGLVTSEEEALNIGVYFHLQIALGSLRIVKNSFLKSSKNQIPKLFKFAKWLEAISSSWRCLSSAHPDLCNNKEVVRIALRPEDNRGKQKKLVQSRKTERCLNWATKFLVWLMILINSSPMFAVSMQPTFMNLWRSVEMPFLVWGSIGWPWLKPPPLCDNSEIWWRKLCKAVLGRQSFV